MQGKSEEFLDGKSTAWEAVGPGLTRQIMGYDGQVMMVKVAFETGAVGEIHSHPHAQVSYVESGEFEVVIGTQVRTLRGGDGFYIPPNTKHGCTCTEAGVLIDSFSPARDDFLEPPEGAD